MSSCCCNCKVTANKNHECDKVGCICIPTDRKASVCAYKNENGEIVCCDNCRCNNSKFNDVRCACVRSDETGNTETGDCCCKAVEEVIDYYCKELQLERVPCSDNREEACGENRSDMMVQQCDKPGCVCLPTNGKSSICVYENDNGEIVRCDGLKGDNCVDIDNDDSGIMNQITFDVNCICDNRGRVSVHIENEVSGIDNNIYIVINKMRLECYCDKPITMDCCSSRIEESCTVPEDENNSIRGCNPGCERCVYIKNKSSGVRNNIIFRVGSTRVRCVPNEEATMCCKCRIAKYLSSMPEDDCVRIDNNTSSVNGNFIIHRKYRRCVQVANNVSEVGNRVSIVAIQICH